MSDREELDALRRMAELEAKASGSSASTSAPLPAAPTENNSYLNQAWTAAKNLAPGAVRGASSIGATILAPLNAAYKGTGQTGAREDREKMVSGVDQGLQVLGADPKNIGYQVGKVGAEIAGTLGVGPAVAPLAVATNAPRLAAALRASGFAKKSGIGANTVAGAVTGGLSATAADSNPTSTAVGTAIGGGLPAGGKLVGAFAKPVLARFGSKPAINSLAEDAAEAMAGKDREFVLNAADNAQPYAGATPTIAEAVAGAQAPNSIQGGRLIAGQRSYTGAKGIEDIIPSAQQAQQNALENTLAPFAGGRTKAEQESALAAAEALRNGVRDVNYGSAYASDAMRQEMDAARRLQQGGGIQNAAPAAQPTPGIQALAQDDAFNAALDASKKYYGNKEGAVTSLEGLQKIKLAIDDALSGAKQDTNLSKYNTKDLLKVKKQLLSEMEGLSPLYEVGRSNFAQNSVLPNQLRVNQALFNKLENPSGELTGRQWLTATDTGEAALLNKAGQKRFENTISGALRDNPENIAAIDAITQHFDRAAKTQQIGSKISGDGVGSQIPSIPHIGKTAMLADAIRKAINGDNVNSVVALSMTNPAEFAKLLRGLPVNKKLEVVRRLSTQGATVGSADAADAMAH